MTPGPRGPGRGRGRGRGDEGVTIILVALSMVAILLVAATVLDYGNVRNSRQDNKLIADVASTAGAQSLAPDGVPRPWRGVCAALAYLEANQSDLSLTITYRDGAANPLAGNPCASLADQVCVASTPSTWAWIQAVDSTHTFDIRSGYTTPDADFPEDAAAYAGDDGAIDSGGCDQLAVIASKTDPVFFGGVAGVDRYDTTSRSVGRVRVGTEGDGVPAFLMLERRACDTLSEQVGSGEAGIIVDAAGPNDPGIIHVDSSGSPATGCNGNNNPGGWAVYSSGTGGPKIVAHPSTDGQAGIIAINALRIGVPPAAYGGATLAGLSPAPTAGRVVSRRPVDNKYNPSSAPTISAIHAAAAIDANRSSAPAGWTTLSGGACNGGSSAATQVFADCPAGFSAGNPSTFANATDIIFNGPVSVANNRQLYAPAARRIVVGGTTGGGLTTAGGSRLGINSATGFADTEAGVVSACDGREGPAWAQTTELVIFGGRSSGTDGALHVGGRAALCQTFVYLAGPKTNPTYAAQQITNGSYDPTCVAARPCALTTGNTATNAHLVVAGGLLQWSAPNQDTEQPAPGSVGVEDLALWTESAQLSEVKSGGDVRARGVFFLPNGRLEMRSPSSAAPRDAQFIARTLQLIQGTLRMQPTPGNNVEVPVLAGVGLVR